eukprot:403369722
MGGLCSCAQPGKSSSGIQDRTSQFSILKEHQLRRQQQQTSTDQTEASVPLEFYNNNSVINQSITTPNNVLYTHRESMITLEDHEDNFQQNAKFIKIQQQNLLGKIKQFQSLLNLCTHCQLDKKLEKYQDMSDKLRKVVQKINPQAESYNDLMSTLLRDMQSNSPSPDKNSKQQTPVDTRMGTPSKLSSMSVLADLNQLDKIEGSFHQDILLSNPKTQRGMTSMSSSLSLTPSKCHSGAVLQYEHKFKKCLESYEYDVVSFEMQADLLILSQQSEIILKSLQKYEGLQGLDTKVAEEFSLIPQYLNEQDTKKQLDSIHKAIELFQKNQETLQQTYQQNILDQVCQICQTLQDLKYQILTLDEQANILVKQFEETKKEVQMFQIAQPKYAEDLDQQQTSIFEMGSEIQQLTVQVNDHLKQLIMQLIEAIKNDDLPIQSVLSSLHQIMQEADGTKNLISTLMEYVDLLLEQNQTTTTIGAQLDQSEGGVLGIKIEAQLLNMKQMLEQIEDEKGFLEETDEDAMLQQITQLSQMIAQNEYMVEIQKSQILIQQKNLEINQSYKDYVKYQEFCQKIRLDLLYIQNEIFSKFDDLRQDFSENNHPYIQKLGLIFQQFLKQSDLYHQLITEKSFDFYQTTLNFIVENRSLSDNDHQFYQLNSEDLFKEMEIISNVLGSLQKYLGEFEMVVVFSNKQRTQRSTTDFHSRSVSQVSQDLQNQINTLPLIIGQQFTKFDKTLYDIMTSEVQQKT